MYITILLWLFLRHLITHVIYLQAMPPNSPDTSRHRPHWLTNPGHGPHSTRNSWPALKAWLWSREAILLRRPGWKFGAPMMGRARNYQTFPLVSPVATAWTTWTASFTSATCQHAGKESMMHLLKVLVEQIFCSPISLCIANIHFMKLTINSFCSTRPILVTRFFLLLMNFQLEDILMLKFPVEILNDEKVFCNNG